MKAKLYDIKGKEKGTIELPKVFESEIRRDIVEKVLEAKLKDSEFFLSQDTKESLAEKVDKLKNIIFLENISMIKS